MMSMLSENWLRSITVRDFNFSIGQTVYVNNGGDSWSSADFKKYTIIGITHDGGGKILYKCTDNEEGLYTYIYEWCLYSSPEEFKQDYIKLQEELDKTIYSPYYLHDINLLGHI